MWPWGHLAVGYLLYSGFCRVRWQRPPVETAAILVAFGTQFPDLIDKPLAWTFGVLPTGRSLTHSLVLASLLLGIAFVYARRSDRMHPTHWAAFATGYLSHLFADALYPLWTGEYAYTAFLLWPVTTTPPYETQQSFVAHFMQMEVTSFFLVQLLLMAGALIVWWLDGTPGKNLLQSGTRRAFSWTK
ncbi:metal-dependent hydrolase [Haladaptatus sp. NG-SE-30]